MNVRKCTNSIKETKGKDRTAENMNASPAVARGMAELPRTYAGRLRRLLQEAKAIQRELALQDGLVQAGPSADDLMVARHGKLLPAFS